MVKELITGGHDMLGFIFRLIRDFEQEHGIHPNLLYLSPFHHKHLEAAFAEGFSIQRIQDVLKMELFIDHDIMHPHVAWTHTAQRKIAS